MEIPKALGGRLILIIPIAFCLFLILESQDRLVRLAAVIGLILLEQLREWLLISAMKPPASGKAPATKDNKH